MVHASGSLRAICNGAPSCIKAATALQSVLSSGVKRCIAFDRAKLHLNARNGSRLSRCSVIVTSVTFPHNVTIIQLVIHCTGTPWNQDHSACLGNRLRYCSHCYRKAAGQHSGGPSAHLWLHVCYLEEGGSPYCCSDFHSPLHRFLRHKVVNRGASAAFFSTIQQHHHHTRVWSQCGSCVQHTLLMHTECELCCWQCTGFRCCLQGTCCCCSCMHQCAIPECNIGQGCTSRAASCIMSFGAQFATAGVTNMVCGLHDRSHLTMIMSWCRS